MRVVARSGQGDMSYVISQIEVGVVYPNRVPLHRDPLQALPVARDVLEAIADKPADLLDVHPPVGGAEMAFGEDQSRRDVHRVVGSFHGKEGVVQEGEAFVHRAGRVSESGHSDGG